MARAWGVAAALPAAVGLGVVAVVAGDVHVDLPVLTNRVIVAHLLPVLAATALGFPLVDRMPDLTAVAGRPVVLLLGARFVATVAASLPVAVCLDLAGWTAAGASVVVGFMGVAAAGVALCGLWYWAPMLAGLVLWAQLRPPDHAATADAVWWAWSMGAAALGAAAYVGIGVLRVRRVVRGVGAESERGWRLATMRP